MFQGAPFLQHCCLQDTISSLEGSESLHYTTLVLDDPSMVLTHPTCWNLCNCPGTKMFPPISLEILTAICCQIFQLLSRTPSSFIFYGSWGFTIINASTGFCSGAQHCHPAIHDHDMLSRLIPLSNSYMKFGCQHEMKPQATLNHNFCVMTLRKYSQFALNGPDLL